VTCVTCRCQRQIALHATKFHKSEIHLVGNCFYRYPRTTSVERAAAAPPDSPSQPHMTLENSGSTENGKWMSISIQSYMLSGSVPIVIRNGTVNGKYLYVPATLTPCNPLSETRSPIKSRNPPNGEGAGQRDRTGSKVDAIRRVGRGSWRVWVFHGRAGCRRDVRLHRRLSAASPDRALESERTPPTQTTPSRDPRNTCTFNVDHKP
jgi:hypothetical protein